MSVQPEIDVSRLRPGVAVRSAFTLVELLVVLAILAVLAAILLPAIALVRRSAQRAVCASNLRQTGISISAYEDDHHALPPPICNHNWTFGNLSSTADAGGTPVAAAALSLAGYVEQPRIFYCPAKSQVDRAWWNTAESEIDIPADLTYCYIGYCWWAGYSFMYGPTPSGITTDRWSPASTVMCSDMSFPTVPNFPTGSHLQGSGIDPRGGNSLYRDGRVAWVPFTDMSLRQTYFMSFYF